MAPTAAKRTPGRPRKEQPDAAAPVLSSALGENELAGLFAEAFEAYDYADQRVRFDTLARRWTFQLYQTANQTELHLILKHGEDERSDRISTALVASELGKGLIEDTIRALDKALS
jgi:hypothetical protein